MIERLKTYSLEDAHGIGRLMPFLSPKFSSDPIPRQLLEDIINSPFHDQLVARLDAKIVGAATLSVTVGAGAGKKAFLEDFVTDPHVRGRGIGKQLWQEMLAWVQEKGAAELQFTSSAHRTDAHAFYRQNGAAEYDTTVFRVPIIQR